MKNIKKFNESSFELGHEETDEEFEKREIEYNEFLDNFEIEFKDLIEKYESDYPNEMVDKEPLLEYIANILGFRHIQIYN